MYESFAGNGMLCNPEAIFRGLRAEPDFAGLKHIWVLSSADDNPETVREFAHDRSVRFVRPSSIGYYRALATSGYLVNNATFPPEFGKRAGQVYLNTWHGTPLKRMGYDIGDAASRVANVIRNFLSADYLLAANHFMVEQMYETAHLLRNVYRGQIIEEGYPRIDYQFAGATQVGEVRRRLEGTGLPVGDRKIILYAPTWKGESFAEPSDDAEELMARVLELESLIDTDRYVVLLKTHQAVHSFAANRPEFAGRLVPNEIPTNQVLSATDILITDYSSTFFDFLATGRPVVFLTPDIDDYTGYRGLYSEPEDWPGPVVRTTRDLAAELRSIDEIGERAEITPRYRAMRDRMSNHDDGHATARIIDIVFRHHTAGYTVGPVTRDARPSILINAGSMRPNGITSSVLGLLEHIDHQRFDVSVVFPYSRSLAVIGKQKEIHPAVRQFTRVGGMNGSKFGQLARQIALLRGDLSKHETSPWQKRLWDDEWTRCFGSSRFDHVIDFSGYGSLWASLMLHAPDAQRSIWLHNDMGANTGLDGAGRASDRWASDRWANKGHGRVGSGRRDRGGSRSRGRGRAFRDLRAIYSLYPDYDRLVSESPELEAANAQALSAFAPRRKFVSAAGLIDAVRVRTKAAVDLRDAVVRTAHGQVPGWATELSQNTRLAGPPGKAGEAGTAAASAALHRGLAVATVLPSATFVSVGRLSVEKNYALLIRAFARVRAEAPATRLIIVGGGPLLGELGRLIGELKLTDAVVLAGQQPNPYPIMARSDCVVLARDFPAKSMVTLEARVLGLPVVATAPAPVVDMAAERDGLLVPGTETGLRDGMLAFLRGDVAPTSIDSDAYNATAIDQFYRAIGVDRAAA
jgi:CDP-glycerol glycerophosphotransferase (TagB/SpsB family)/glycosyltransferase involved in cell wall biosynthesis